MSWAIYTGYCTYYTLKHCYCSDYFLCYAKVIFIHCLCFWSFAVEESDIIDLEKRYWLLKAQSRTGRFDLETFVPLVSPPIHASLSEGNVIFMNAGIKWTIWLLPRHISHPIFTPTCIHLWLLFKKFHGSVMMMALEDGIYICFSLNIF